MTQIVIQVRGGVVQHIATNTEAEIILIDWDNIEAGDDYPSTEDAMSEDYFFEDLKTYLNENRP
jgi:hypothetical protein